MPYYEILVQTSEKLHNFTNRGTLKTFIMLVQPNFSIKLRLSSNNSLQNMILFFLLIPNFINAVDTNLNAVHYSIVTPGVDSQIKPGII